MSLDIIWLDRKLIHSANLYWSKIRCIMVLNLHLDFKNSSIDFVTSSWNWKCQIEIRIIMISQGKSTQILKSISFHFLPLLQVHSIFFMMYFKTFMRDAIIFNENGRPRSGFLFYLNHLTHLDNTSQYILSKVVKNNLEFLSWYEWCLTFFLWSLASSIKGTADVNLLFCSI